MAMVTASVSSPSSAQDIPTAVPVPQKPPSSRRLPPPCWSHDETVALIDAYRDKWYSLRRGNLRANHWQEVADDVATRCSPAPGNLPKTSVQCRHKMEKLRKRYRSEMQRAVSIPGSSSNSHRFSSSWVHFKRMDSMERGTNVVAPVSQPELAIAIRDNEDEDDDNEIDEDEDLYQATMKRSALPYNRSGYENGNANGFRIRIPGRPDVAMVGGGNKKYSSGGSKYERYSGGDNPPTSFTTSSRVLKDCYTKMGGSSGGGGGGVGVAAAAGGKKKREGDPVEEIALALKSLGDGFVRMERMKMEMAREVESMRMEMEMKRTEMILESQQRIVEAFARACTEKKNKKMKRMLPPSPE
ncbi:protein FIP2-like [Impatiens glandulifera]|uniref:protein FIP2-like n=1 Tax=Impatiens glandulifera TaxID=253017 RepID=UPI001FB196BB|nr:protein FIP2-like [Impatiens glandulifera]XP_047324195.1 protein FIP2-like [Impatiens glandulifera]XP_047324196.1 protein FIP2-like [Impatiens glandulifera]